MMNYLTLILRGLKFSTFHTNLLTIPAYVLFLLQLLLWTWVSERINNRFLIVMICQIWCLPLLIGLEVLSQHASPWVKYTLSILLVGYPYIHAVLGTKFLSRGVVKKFAYAAYLVALTSRNAGSVRTRTVGSALYNMFVQASSVISSQVCLLWFR